MTTLPCFKIDLKQGKYFSFSCLFKWINIVIVTNSFKKIDMDKYSLYKFEVTGDLWSEKCYEFI
jgi:hypothetical protein